MKNNEKRVVDSYEIKHSIENRQCGPIMNTEVISGYTITDKLAVGNAEFVVGQNDNAPSPFVTWRRNIEEDGSRSGCYWGHYCNNRLSAINDLTVRVQEETHSLQSVEKELAEQKEKRAVKSKDLER
jgi:hypothetical protein